VVLFRVIKICNPPAHHTVVIFDGVCNLCNAAVNFVIDRDPADRFRFAPNASEAAQAQLRRCGAPDGLTSQTILLVEPDGRCYSRSAAALRIARRLKAPWPLLYAGVALPRPVRDWLYDQVARRRYRWFGKRDACRMPTPALQARFLSDSPVTAAAAAAAAAAAPGTPPNG
jgi:predicted DCC family thiol-disulfide oxidoreductase YuxK